MTPPTIKRKRIISADIKKTETRRIYSKIYGETLNSTSAAFVKKITIAATLLNFGLRGLQAII
jgi:hypothetical protein